MTLSWLSGIVEPTSASKRGPTRSLLLAGVVLVGGGAQAQVEQTYLKASNTGAGDLFGNSSAADGDTLIIGAPGEASNTNGVDPPVNNLGFGAGAVYVFVRSGTSWTQQAFLKASNSNGLDDFGWSVALCGDTLVVGAEREDSSAAGVNGVQADNSLNDSGAAYVFVRNGTTWSQQAYLKASNPGAGDHFGEFVAISGDTIVVGADDERSSATGVNGDGDNDDTFGAGAAYVFVRTGTTWSQEAYLKASNTDFGDRFGGRVGISGDTIVVAADLEDSSATGVNGDQFDEGANIAGAAYVFVRTGTDWSQQAYLKAHNAGDEDKFGSAVAIDGDRIVVGAQGESGGSTGIDPPDNNAAYASGAAYIFERIGTDWSQAEYIKSSNTGTLDFFGRALDLEGDRLLIGADGESSDATSVGGDQTSDSKFGAGAAYLFERVDSGWSQVAYVKSLDTDGQDVFGFSVGLSQDWLVVGSPWEDSNATGVGGDTTDNSLVFAGCANALAIDFPSFYCVPKTSSAGCQAQLTTSNVSAQPISGAGDYFVDATALQGLKPGLLFGGFTGVATIPFGGGTLCTSPPLKRGTIGLSGGSGPLSCDGSSMTLVNDGVVPGLDPGPGVSGWYQYWYRDPMNGVGNFGTALSNAVQLDFR